MFRDPLLCRIETYFRDSLIPRQTVPRTIKPSNDDAPVLPSLRFEDSPYQILRLRSASCMRRATSLLESLLDRPTFMGAGTLPAAISRYRVRRLTPNFDATSFRRSQQSPGCPTPVVTSSSLGHYPARSALGLLPLSTPLTLFQHEITQSLTLLLSHRVADHLSDDACNRRRPHDFLYD